jgi:hypothetical protein
MTPSRPVVLITGLLAALGGVVALGAFFVFIHPPTRLDALPLPTLAPTLSIPTMTAPTPTLAYPTLPPPWTPSPTPPPPTATPTRPPPSPTAVPVSRLGPENFPRNVNPLTGEVVSDPALLDLRPLTVKVANTRPCARPQSGLNQAALVFEHYVEAWGTRFTALFYGAQVEKVGPVRSARLIDLELPAIFDSILVTSGASGGVRQRLQESDFAERVIAGLGGDCPPLCRVPQDTVPCQDPAHTLYTNTADLHQIAAVAGLDVRPRLSGWSFRTSPPRGGRPADLVQVGYFNAPADWSYDSASSLYLRSQDETRQVDALTGLRLTAANVVVLYAHHLYTDIQESTNFYSLEIQFWGQGRALVFRDGQAFEGVWLRPGRHGLFRLVDASGAPIPLKPGRTWFEFVPLDSTVEVRGSEWAITAPILEQLTPPLPW